MKNFAYLFVLTFLVFNCSSEEDGIEPNRSEPGPFSVTILETRMDGANIEWTEAIDIDGDPITYSIYLEDVLLSTGVTATSYNFTGLEPEISYDGYILAEDGKGGTSRDDFFFLTKPETVIFTVNASFWVESSVPEEGGERVLLGGGFEIPFYDDATRYQIEISSAGYTIDGVVYEAGSVYTWTNESQTGPVHYIEATGKYGVRFAGISVNTIGPDYDYYIDLLTNATGEAQVIITF